MLTQRLQNLQPYTPGEQPKDRHYIKLNANENPYPPSPQVTSAINKLLTDNPMAPALYPDPDSTVLRTAVARMLNSTGGVLCRTIEKDGKCIPAPQDILPQQITADMIFTGNGSDEVLSFLFYAFFEQDRPIVLPQFTYSFYPVYASYYHIPLCTVPLLQDMQLNIPALLDAAHRTHSSIILANPNAPTALGITRQQVRTLLNNCPPGQIVAVDEAYVDFGGESCLPLLAEYDNLIIIRTFSKSFSLAGMRLGYAVAQPHLIQALTTVKNSFNHFPCDVIAQTAGIAACNDTAYYVQTAKRIVLTRNNFTTFLRSSGWQTFDSQTNFLFTCKPPYKGHAVYEYIKQKGILIRHFATDGIENYIRITIGTDSQMEQLQDCLKNIPSADQLLL